MYVSQNEVSFTGDIKLNSGNQAIYAKGPDKKGFVVNENGIFYDGDLC